MISPGLISNGGGGTCTNPGTLQPALQKVAQAASLESLPETKTAQLKEAPQNSEPFYDPGTLLRESPVLAFPKVQQYAGGEQAATGNSQIKSSRQADRTLTTAQNHKSAAPGYHTMMSSNLRLNWAEIICVTISNSPEGRLVVQDLLEAMCDRFPIIREWATGNDWEARVKNRIKSTLSIKGHLFIKVSKPNNTNKKGCWWTLSREAEEACQAGRISEYLRGGSRSSSTTHFAGENMYVLRRGVRTPSTRRAQDYPHVSPRQARSRHFEHDNGRTRVPSRTLSFEVPVSHDQGNMDVGDGAMRRVNSFMSTPFLQSFGNPFPMNSPSSSIFGDGPKCSSPMSSPSLNTQPSIGMEHANPFGLPQSSGFPFPSAEQQLLAMGSMSNLNVDACNPIPFQHQTSPLPLLHHECAKNVQPPSHATFALNQTTAMMPPCASPPNHFFTMNSSNTNYENLSMMTMDPGLHAMRANSYPIPDQALSGSNHMDQLMGFGQMNGNAVPPGPPVSASMPGTPHFDQLFRPMKDTRQETAPQFSFPNAEFGPDQRRRGQSVDEGMWGSTGNLHSA